MIVDRNAPVELRFDDPDFIEALARDASVEDKAWELTGRGPLARLLGVDKATDFDFGDYIADGWVIYARGAVAGGDEDGLVDTAQRKGGGTEVSAYNRAWWPLWVKGVSLDNVEDLDRPVRAIVDGLCARHDKTRGDAYSALPAPTRDAFTARLRAHVDVVNRPADRDPGKAPGVTEVWSPGTPPSSNGVRRAKSAALPTEPDQATG